MNVPLLSLGIEPAYALLHALAGGQITQRAVTGVVESFMFENTRDLSA